MVYYICRREQHTMIAGEKQFLQFFSDSFKIKFLTFLVFFCLIVKTNAQSSDYKGDDVIYITDHSVLISDSSSLRAKVIVISASINKSEKEKQQVKTVSKKKLLAKSLVSKKKYTPVAKIKAHHFFKNTESTKDFLIGNGVIKNNSVPLSNYAFTGDLTSYCERLNVSIFVHLKKVSTKKNLVISEYSDAFYSRPPPSFHL